MPDEIVVPVSENLAENAPGGESHPSEPAEVPEQTDEPETPENIAEESDEQNNARVQKEAATKAEKKARGVQKRLDELTAEKYAERKRADALAEQNSRMLALLEGKQNQPQIQGNGAPTREQYQDDWSFLSAHNAYEARRVAAEEAKTIIDKAFKETQEQQHRATVEKTEREISSRYLERQKAFAAKTPDWVETMDDADIDVPDTVYQSLRRMEDGPAIAYQFVKNPELVQQFYASPPDMHGILLGQISATLKASPSLSKAAPPGKPVKSTPGSSVEPPSDPDKYFEWAQKHMR